MIEDHLGVVDEAGTSAERADSRLSELLDREILPCLERPGRLLGPFDVSLEFSARASNVALIWPCTFEGIRAPAALRPMFEDVAALASLQPSLACVPADDLERALEKHRLVLFGRPDRLPLARCPLWIAPIDEPLHLLGLLTILRAAGLPLRATERTDEHPVVVLVGDGARRAGDLALVYADAVVAREHLDRSWFERWARSLAARPASLRSALAAAIGADEGVRIGALEAPRGSSLRDVELVNHIGGGPRRDDVAALLVHGPGQLARPRRVREEGRADSYTERLWLGSASARLRERFGFVDGTTFAADLVEVLGDEAGALALDVVWGLPGETAADRAALAPLLDAIVAVAPRGVRQLRVRLGWYVPSAEERSQGARTLDDAEAAASLDELRSSLAAKRLRIDTTPAARAAVATVLEGASCDLAPVLEAIHAAGAREADSPFACDPARWRSALAAMGIEGRWPASQAGRADRRPAAHGIGRLVVRAPGRAAASATAPRTHDDRWSRWQALVPRQFEVRLEFGKLGPMVLLGPGEVTEVFLVALERAGVGLAVSGVAQPRPRISFGPVLPAGIGGRREVVDLGLERPVPDLVARLRRTLPEGLHPRAAVALPLHAPALALGQVWRAEYEVFVAPDAFEGPQARARSLELLHAWRRRLEQGAPCVDDDADTLRQLSELHVEEDPDGALRVRFQLDLTDPGPKCRPRDVVVRGLEGLAVDVRCLPMHRLRLLALEEELGRRVVVTPFEQVLRAERRQRARAKYNA